MVFSHFIHLVFDSFSFCGPNAHTHLDASLQSLNDISKSWEPFNKSICIILLLCYKDLFLEQAATANLKELFPSYEGIASFSRSKSNCLFLGELNAEKSLDYIVDFFATKVCFLTFARITLILLSGKQ